MLKTDCNTILRTGEIMKANMGDREQKIRLAIGSAAAATAVWAPLRYKWKGWLSVLAATQLIFGLTRFSPSKKFLGV
jgi:hypothetical protein